MKMKIATNKTDALSDGDIERIGNLLDNAFDGRLRPIDKRLGVIEATMVTKQDLKDEINGVEVRLKSYIHDGVETIMDGMDKLSEQLAEKERVDRLEQWTREIAKKVGVNLV